METATKTSDQQATNAALAALAATGNSYALGQLWELNKGLLRSMFWKWYPAHKAQADAHGLTADDFEQEGFFAVQHAAQTYDPAQGAFTTWLTAAMQRQIQHLDQRPRPRRDRRGRQAAHHQRRPAEPLHQPGRAPGR